MGIRAKCPACGHSMKLKAFLAGKRGICPKCQTSFDIPSDAADSSAATPQPRAVAAGAATGTNHSSATPVARPSNVPARPASPHPATAQAPTQAAPRAAAPAPVATPVQGAGYTPSAAPVLPAPMQPAGYTPATPVQPAAVPVQPAPVVAVPLPQQGYTSGPVPTVVAVGATAGMPDPLVEAPQAMWYVRPVSGGQFGPAGADMMRQWLQEGRVAADTLVWRDGWADWQTAGSCFPQLGAFAEAETPSQGVDLISTGPTVTTGRPMVYRRRSGGQVTLIVFLLVALLALMPLLVWVLSRNM